MQLLIKGVPYDLFESITHAKLSDLRKLHQEGKKLGHPITVKVVRDYLMALIDSTVPFDFVDSEEHLLDLQGLIFLCRRHAGEDVTFLDGEEFQLADLTFSYETEVDKADPKEPTASAAAESDAPAV